MKKQGKTEKQRFEMEIQSQNQALYFFVSVQL